MEYGTDDGCGRRCQAPEIWPDWEPVLRLFGRCGTLWRSGFSGPVGLDYPSVMVVSQILGVDLDAESLDRLQALEQGALEAMNGK